VGFAAWWKHRWPWLFCGGFVLLLAGAVSLSGVLHGGRGAAPAPAVPSAASPVVMAVIPRDLLGKSLAEARDELASVGFHTIAVESADGRPIAGDPASTVVAVGGPGAVVPLSTTILLRVGDPPTAAPRVTVPVTEPPATTQADTPRAIPPTAPPPRPGASSPTTTTTATEVVYYRNCGQVRRAGAAPLHIGRPGYRPELDKDGDGVACDKDKDK
jgi:hypothetical protein